MEDGKHSKAVREEREREREQEQKIKTERRCCKMKRRAEQGEEQDEWRRGIVAICRLRIQTGGLTIFPVIICRNSEKSISPSPLLSTSEIIFCNSSFLILMPITFTHMLRHTIRPTSRKASHSLSHRGREYERLAEGDRGKKMSDGVKVAVDWMYRNAIREMRIG